MRRSDGIRLGSYHGASIVLAYSWFLAFVFILFAFGPRFGHRQVLGIGQGYYIAVLYAIMLLISIFFHEIAHAVAARHFGFQVQRITLNLWGGFTQFTECKATPGNTLVTSLAGPATNFLFAAIIFCVTIILSPDDYILGEILDIFFWMNVVLGFFNSVPAAPLDGGRIIETIVWKLTGNRGKGMVVSGWAGKIIAAILIVFMLAPLVRGEQAQFITLAVMLVIISTIWVGSTQAVYSGRLMQKNSGISAYALARKIISVDRRNTVAHLKSLMVDCNYNPREQVFAVISPEGAAQAIVDDDALLRIPAVQENFLSLDPILQTITPAMMVPATLSGEELFQETVASGPANIRYYVVVDAYGKPLGIFSRQTAILAMQP